MAAARSPIEETFRGGGGGTGVQLVDPTGGGGAQIARPTESAAPNFAGMFSEATRAALEPAKFMWGMYKDREELSNQQKTLLLKGQEVAETQRSNLIREEQELARQRIDEMKERETERHNQADESRSAIVDKETERRNRADEALRNLNLIRESARDEWEKSASDVRADYEKAQTEKAQKELDDTRHDEQVIADFNKKIEPFGKMDHYNIYDHPELADIYHDALSQLKTKFGQDQLERIRGGNLALGQELDQQTKMVNWTPEAHDKFLATMRRLSNQGPEAPQLSAQERWNQAYEAGDEVNKLELTKKDFGAHGNDAYEKTFHALLAANPTMSREEAERKAIMAGRDADEEFKAGLKRTERSNLAPTKPSEIVGQGGLIETSFPIDTTKNETDAQWQERIGPYKAQALEAEKDHPGGAQEYVNTLKRVLKQQTEAGQGGDFNKHIDDKLGKQAKPTPVIPPASTVRLTPTTGSREQKAATVPDQSDIKPATTYTAPPDWGAPKSTTALPITGTQDVAQNIPLSFWDYYQKQFNQPEEVT